MTQLALNAAEYHIATRADEVLQRINEIKGTLMERSLELGRLLREARNNNYAPQYGYARFGDWVEEGSGLDMSERSAYDLIKLVERAEELAIPDEQLVRGKISSLKAIFSLPADTDPERVRELVTEAETAKLKDIRAIVGVLKNLDFVYKTLKLERTTNDNVYEPAMERARREYGNTIGFDGDLRDITDSRCIELIMASYLAEPMEQEEEIVDAEWADLNDPLPEAA